MKKISLFALATAGTMMTMAQKPVFGLKAGLNLAKLTNTNSDFKAGFHAGLLSHIHVTPAFSLQPEVMYSTQGAKYSDDARYNLGYVNIPVLLQYNFGDGFRLQGGPQLGILTNATYKIGDTDYDVSDAFKTIDFSIPVGLGYLSKSGLGLDARYNIGVTDVTEAAGSSVRNGVIQFGLFYLFNSRHKQQSR